MRSVMIMPGTVVRFMIRAAMSIAVRLMVSRLFVPVRFFVILMFAMTVSFGRERRRRQHSGKFVQRYKAVFVGIGGFEILEQVFLGCDIAVKLFHSFAKFSLGQRLAVVGIRMAEFSMKIYRAGQTGMKRPLVPWKAGSGKDCT